MVSQGQAFANILLYFPNHKGEFLFTSPPRFLNKIKDGLAMWGGALHPPEGGPLGAPLFTWES